jgi:hypothetical protein
MLHSSHFSASMGYLDNVAIIGGGLGVCTLSPLELSTVMLTILRIGLRASTGLVCRKHTSESLRVSPPRL